MPGAYDVQHLPWRYDEWYAWEVPGIAGHKISVRIFALFRDDLIKYDILGVGESSIARSGIYVDTKRDKRAYQIICRYWGKMKFFPPQHVAVFAKNIIVQQRNDLTASNFIQNGSGRGVCVEHGGDKHICI